MTHPGNQESGTTASGSPAAAPFSRAVEQRFKRRSAVKIAVFALTAVGLLLLVRFAHLSQLLDSQWVDEHIKVLGSAGVVLFVALAAALTAVGVPRQLFALLGGYAYGLLPGTLLALMGMCLGCAVSFFYARLMGRSFVQRRLGGRLRRLDNVFCQSPVTTTLLLRFLPFTNNLVTNLAAGVSTVKAGWFLLGSAVGYLPQTLLFAMLGSGVKVGRIWQVALSIALFAASLALAFFMLRKHRRLYKVVQNEE